MADVNLLCVNFLLAKKFALCSGHLKIRSQV